MKVSIIVPVYNVEDYLDKCLNSLVNQTLKDIEIIIVNDGSTDKSQIIIDKFKKKDKRIKAFSKKNGGLGDARNFGLDKASGEYIGFVDSDDYVSKDMYEKLYNNAIKNKSDLVESNFIWVYPNKQIIDKASYYDNFDSIFLNMRVLVATKLFKKELIDKYKIKFPVGLLYEDILFTYKVLAHTNKISYINKATYYYVQRKNSLSNFQTKRVRDIFNILDQLKEYYKKHNLYHKFAPKIEYLFIKYLLGSSFLRVIKVKGFKLRRSILNETWNFLNQSFPKWKRNIYLKDYKPKNIYYRCLNKFTYNISSLIFRIIK